MSHGPPQYGPIGAVRSRISAALDDFMLYFSFNDLLAFDARAVPAFLRDTNYTFRTQWYILECADEAYWVWQLARGAYAVAHVYVSPSPHMFSGVVWQMRRGADFFNILAGYGAAPGWVHQGLCFDSPAVCKDDENGVVAVHSLDWNKHTSVEMAAALDACWARAQASSSVDVFYCALERAPPPPGEM